MLVILLAACTGDPDAPPAPTTPPVPVSPAPTVGLPTQVTAQLHPQFETLIEVTWKQASPDPGHLQFRTVGGVWRDSPAGSQEGDVMRQSILGVPYDADVEYRVVLPSGETSPIEPIRTGVRPETLPVPIILANDPSLTEPTAPYVITGMNFDGEDRYGRWWTFIMDREGQVVWALDTTRDWVSRHVSVSFDQQALLVDHDTYWTQFDDGAASQILRMTLDGTIEHTYDVPGLHHPFVPLPDDLIAWGAADGSTETLEIVDLDGNQEQLWTCSDFLSSLPFTSYCGSNALNWDAKTDHFLFSFWSSDTVVEIDRQTGETVRWFGDLPGSWAFDPPESQFWWQHGALFTDARTLLVSTKDRLNGDETMVREYRLDEGTQTLTEIWNFGQGRGVYGQYMGEAHRLPNGNTLHVYGAGGHLAEATPSGDVAWEVTWEGDKHNGRTTPWDDLYQLL